MQRFRIRKVGGGHAVVDTALDVRIVTFINRDVACVCGAALNIAHEHGALATLYLGLKHSTEKHDLVWESVPDSMEAM